MPGLYLDGSSPSVRALCRHRESRTRREGETREKKNEKRDRERENERGARRSRGRFHRGTRSSGARHEETEGDMERPATTHANLQIRSVKVRHCGRVGGGLGPSSATEHCLASVVHVAMFRTFVETWFMKLSLRR